MRIFLITHILFIFLISGCSSMANRTDFQLAKAELMKDYLTKVSKADGIDRAEAVLLAKSQFIFRGHDKNYHLDRPRIVLDNSEYWTVKFDPINKTLKEVITKPDVYILIDKQDGSTRWNEENPQWENR